MKYIREGRFGPQKSFKTGAVVGTYPKPMLVMSFDEAGLDVIPSQRVSIPAGFIPLDVVAEDIVKIKADALPAYLAKPSSEQPKVLLLDLADMVAPPVNLAYKPTSNSSPMAAFVRVTDLLFAQKEKGLPWKTIVLDSVTGLSEIIIAHIASVDSAALNDARKWASQAGTKVLQTAAFLCSLPAHIVMIMHTRIETTEQGVMVGEYPNIFGGAREIVGRLLSQFFYAKKVNGKPIVLTNDQGFIRGVGARWPVGLPTECAPDFNTIYGKELQ